MYVCMPNADYTTTLYYSLDEGRVPDTRILYMSARAHACAYHIYKTVFSRPSTRQSRVSVIYYINRRRLLFFFFGYMPFVRTPRPLHDDIVFFFPSYSSAYFSAAQPSSSAQYTITYNASHNNNNIHARIIIGNSVSFFAFLRGLCRRHILL